MTTRQGSGFIIFVFVMSGLFGGFMITWFAILAGGVYVMAAVTDMTKLTSEVITVANLISFAFYQASVVSLILFSAWKKNINWKLHLFVFVAIPMAVFFWRENIHPIVTRHVLNFIASAAVYLMLVARYEYHQAKGD